LLQYSVLVVVLMVMRIPSVLMGVMAITVGTVAKK